MGFVGKSVHRSGRACNARVYFRITPTFWNSFTTCSARRGSRSVSIALSSYPSSSRGVRPWRIARRLESKAYPTSQTLNPEAQADHKTTRVSGLPVSLDPETCALSGGATP
jgi:hypothetical protein